MIQVCRCNLLRKDISKLNLYLFTSHYVEIIIIFMTSKFWPNNLHYGQQPDQGQVWSTMLTILSAFQTTPHGAVTKF